MDPRRGADTLRAAMEPTRDATAEAAGGQRGAPRIRIALLVLLATVSACALAPATLDPSPASRGADPAAGPWLRLEHVVDRRAQGLRIPAGSAATPFERVLGRQSNAFGRPGGLLRLPADESVSGLVAGLVIDALRASGHRVLGPGEEAPPDVDPRPIRVEILGLWAEAHPRLWQIELGFEATLRISGPLPGLEPGLRVHGASRKTRLFATKAAWRQTIVLGLERLAADLRARLAPRPAAQAAE